MEGFLCRFLKKQTKFINSKLLIDLCNETDLKNNIERYFDGSTINETEKRSVLHTALRSSEIKNPELKKEIEDFDREDHKYFRSYK